MQRPLLSFQLTSNLVFLFSSKSHVHIGQYLPKSPVSSCLSLIKDGVGILHFTSLHCKLSNKQHHLILFARSQFFQQNTSIMHHPTSFDCHQSSLLVVGCNCCKHASSLDNHSCGRLTAQLLKRREGDVWPKGMLAGTCFSKAFASVILCRDIYLHAFVLSELAEAVTLHVGAQRVLGIFPAAQSFLHRAIGHGLMQDWKGVQLLSC